LYVIGGKIVFGKFIVDNVEMYNPNTNTWTVMTSGSGLDIYGGVVVDRP